MKGIGRLAIAIVVTGGLGGVTLTPAWSQNPGQPTPALHCKASSETFPRPAQPQGGKLVPVIVRYMIVVASRPDGPEPPERAAENERVRYFGKRVQRHFWPPTGHASPEKWNINDVWRPAGIQFYILRAETCQYLVDEVSSIPLPIPSPADLSQFHRLNELFNAPGFKGVDVYIWPSFNSDGGYGSPRVTDNGPVAGAVWLKAGVFEIEGPYRKAKTLSPTDPGLPFDTVLLVAHELGHFLKLSHRCAKDGSPPPPPPICQRPGTNEILMSAWADGTLLKPDEREAAINMLNRMGVD
jgi:hypothetical protein